MTTILSITTESGSIYDFRVPAFGEKEVRRRNAGEPMRRDGEWLKVLKFHNEPPNIGDYILLELEPLGDGESTTRMSTRIVSTELQKVEDEEN